jgi:hypothetical protein
MAIHGKSKLHNIMVALSNPKHELFAQSLATGKNQEQSYIAAGYSANDARAKSSRLLATNGNIFGRVNEIQSAAAIKAELTIERLTIDLMRIAQAGEAIGDASGLQAARAAIMDTAKLNGLLVVRSKNEWSMKNGAVFPAMHFIAVAPNHSNDDDRVYSSSVE